MTVHRLLLVVSVTAAWMWLLAGCMPPLETQPTFDIDTAEDNTITYAVDDNAVTFDISSPRGIGEADISLQTGAWPENVILRLYLSGMESLTVSYGDITTTASVSSHGNYGIQHSLQFGGIPVAVDESINHQLTVDIVSGQPVSIPMHEGYFQVQLGDGFAETENNTMNISWIDFYR